jgi:hypothetical protein
VDAVPQNGEGGMVSTGAIIAFILGILAAVLVAKVRGK